MTVVLLGAYLVVRALGNPDGGVAQLWFWALSHNRVVDFTAGSPYLLSGLHLAFGIAWGLAYAGLAEPRLAGPGWRRGIIFSLVPWLASVVVFLPIVGAGLLGSALGAGPLPVIGNLVLHLVYGALLGDLYARARRSSVDLADLSEEMAEQVASMLRAERGVAVGLGAGAAVGLAIGIVVARAFRFELVPATDLAMPLTGAVVGAALGVLIGSLIGTYAVK